MFGKIKESIDKSIVSVSVKSSTYVETEKLKAKVINTEEKIQSQKYEFGNRIYEQWKLNQIDRDYIENVCKRIEEKEIEISQYNFQIEQLTQERAKILGESSGTLNEVALADKIVCICGKANEKEAKFCKACGKKLDSEEIIQAVKNNRQEVCPVCGTELDAGSCFCSECGAVIKG